MGTLPRSGSSSVVVDAPADVVWQIVGDPSRVGQWSHETRAASWLSPADGPAVGARFVGVNKVGRTTWRRTCEIVEIVEIVELDGRRLVWRTVPSAIYRDSTRWTLTVEDIGDGTTRLSQHYEIAYINPFLDRLFFAFIKQHRDRSQALRGDLEQIGALAVELARA
jgi:hypothetical protein